MKDLIVIPLLFITGCASLTNKQIESVIIDKRTNEVKVYPDDVFMTPCGTFTVLKDGTFKEAIGDRPIDAQTLYKCKQSKQVLIDWINRDKENFNKNSNIK